MAVTLKALRRGTHRSASLNDTLKRVLRLAPVMGITRVANVTGLDSVGIPVVMVCRPNSRSVAVSQGKGIDLDSARASGLMEAAELYHAETITLPLRLAAYEEVRYQYSVVEPDDLPRRADSRFHPLLRILWCEGRDLLSGESTISADGRFVVFTSIATNLVAGDTNLAYDVFAHDRDADGNLVTTTYDALGRPKDRIHAYGTATSFYNLAGETIKQRDELGRLTSYRYDPLGRVQTVTDALGKVATTLYDAVGNRTTQTHTKYCFSFDFR